MNQARVDRQRLARRDETAHLGLLDRSEERHALELHQRHQEPARGLRHRFDQEHAGHDRIARKMPLEDGALHGDVSLDRDFLPDRVEVENTVDHLEIFEMHDARY